MRRRPGFTMLELFVVIAVIGLLLALLAPAVSAAVEASRGAKCLNHLRQLAAAIHQYEAVHQMFPGESQSHIVEWPVPGQPPSHNVRGNWASIQSQLLPFLDQSELFEQLNLSKGSVPDAVHAAEWDMLATAMRRRVSVFLCPSDGARLKPGLNYRACLGSGPMYKFNGEFPDSGNGFFAQVYDHPGGQFPIRHSTIVDGMAQTAMFSERLTGSGDVTRFHPLRDSTRLKTNPTTSGPTVARCRVLHELALQGDEGWDPWMGRDWVSSNMRHSIYNHTMPPNAAIADCLLSWGPVSARSGHPGGVNVVFGDGSARFIGDSIDLKVWRALGTRNGGETVLVGSY
jgi:prepilin-type N-terminal cleavage/methylation domain-containing protein/prepilin-type processing-associated H-X9-DG protein